MPTFLPDSGQPPGIKPLSLEFSQNNLDLKQVARSDAWAVYSVHFPDCHKAIGYEAWKIRARKESTVFGKPDPAHEIRPSNEDFGYYAWCFTTIQSVEEFIGREEWSKLEWKDAYNSPLEPCAGAALEQNAPQGVAKVG